MTGRLQSWQMKIGYTPLYSQPLSALSSLWHHTVHVDWCGVLVAVAVIDDDGEWWMVDGVK